MSMSVFPFDNVTLGRLELAQEFGSSPARLARCSRCRRRSHFLYVPAENKDALFCSMPSTLSGSFGLLSFIHFELFAAIYQRDIRGCNKTCRANVGKGDIGYFR